MSKNFEAKKVVVSEIEEKIEKAESIVIVEYKALTVEAITALRAKCRAANVDYCVLKNTLMKRALENKGIKIDDAILEGPNAFVFGNGDPVSAPKLIKEFITAAEKDKKTSPLTIKAGIMDGAVQSVEEVKALADILPRERSSPRSWVASILRRPLWLTSFRRLPTRRPKPASSNLQKTAG